jgi:hypothetical protein
MNARTSIRLAATVGVLTMPAMSAAAASASTLKGTFHISSGSYIRMREPTGSYFQNPYSTAKNKTYTLLVSAPGAGLRTGVIQSAPSPAFDAKGNSLAKSIIEPTSFTGILFGAATTTAPSISVSSGKLSGQVKGLLAEWNKQTFKQGGTVTGTYNAKTHGYVLTWHALVKGGPFNGFTGYWRLQGTFSPS